MVFKLQPAISVWNAFALKKTVRRMITLPTVHTAKHIFATTAAMFIIALAPSVKNHPVQCVARSGYAKCVMKHIAMIVRGFHYVVYATSLSVMIVGQ